MLLIDGSQHCRPEAQLSLLLSCTQQLHLPNIANYSLMSRAQGQIAFVKTSHTLLSKGYSSVPCELRSLYCEQAQQTLPLALADLSEAVQLSIISGSQYLDGYLLNTVADGLQQQQAL